MGTEFFEVFLCNTLKVLQNIHGNGTRSDDSSHVISFLGCAESTDEPTEVSPHSCYVIFLFLAFSFES